MAWQTPKTDWKAGNIPTAADFNRIEGNINYIEQETRTPNQAAIPAASGPLGSILNFFAAQIKRITGKTNWYDAPNKTLEDLNTHIGSKQVHGASGSYYVAKTSRSDQLPAWGDIQGKPPIVQQSSNATITLGSSGWSKNNGEAHVLGEIKAGSIAGDARLMIHSNGGKVNVYVDVEIYVNEGNYKVWHAGNDGPGSGLDADMVDGRHVFVQSSTPTPLAYGDIWIQT